MGRRNDRSRWLPAALLLLVGCGPMTVAGTASTSTFGLAPALTADELALTNLDAALAFVTSDPLDAAFLGAITTSRSGKTTIDANAAATRIASAAVRSFHPATCVEAAAHGPVVRFKFERCEGPYGLAALTGTLTATAAQDGDRLRVELASAQVVVRARAVVVTETLVGFNDSGARSVRVSSTTTHLPVAQARTFTGVVSWAPGGGCLTTNGAGSHFANTRTTTVAVLNDQLCTGACPKAGRISLTDLGRSTTLALDGTATPFATGADGTRQRATLACP